MRHIRRPTGLGGLLIMAFVAPAQAQYYPPPPPYYGGPSPYGQPYMQPYGQVSRPPMSVRCASAMGVCMLPSAGFVGTPCFCNTGFGPAQGQIIP